MTSSQYSDQIISEDVIAVRHSCHRPLLEGLEQVTRGILFRILPWDPQK